MNTSNDNYDSLEELIYSEEIRIQAIEAYPELDMLLVLLNTGGVLKESLSAYPLLKEASRDQLQHYELIGQGVGVHWPDLDEDLSLKGFLREAIRKQVITGRVA